MAKKILNFDVETTGIFPNVHGMVQLAGIVEIDGKCVDVFNFKMRPFEKDKIDVQSLEKIGLTKSEILEWPNPVEAYEDLVKVFSKYIDRYDREDKFYPCGYNVPFDVNFLIQFFKKNDDQYVGSWLNLKAQIDVLSVLRFMDFMGKIDLPDYKLETVANALEIDINAHDAMSDIAATIKIRKIVEELLD